MSPAQALRPSESSSKSSLHYYTDLNVLDSFEAALNPANHHLLPDDWWIVVTDVVNSTAVIGRGDYKDVNTIGAAIIGAALNLDRAVEIPYVFGGDGATLAIPPQLEVPMRRALLATQELARTRFQLDLRIALIPVRNFTASGKLAKIAKYRQSKHLRLAAFSGDAWTTAEAWAKHENTRMIYEVTSTPTLAAEALYTGFECRWQSIPSQRDHKLCVLVTCVDSPSRREAGTIRKVLQLLHETYGDFTTHHPLAEEKLRLTWNPYQLMAEAKIRLPKINVFQTLRYLASTFVLNFIGMILFKFKIDTQSVKWSEYRRDFIANADCRKFDGTIKLILDSSVLESNKLEAGLDSLYQSGEIVFGLHRSPAAIVTCLVFSYSGKHAHFVDGSDGGYALASLELKKRRSVLTNGHELPTHS